MRSQPFLLANPFVRQALFWLCTVLLLTFIYGTAYQSYWLGISTVLMLLPVVMQHSDRMSDSSFNAATLPLYSCSDQICAKPD